MWVQDEIFLNVEGVEGKHEETAEPSDGLFLTTQKRRGKNNISFLVFEDKSARDDSNGLANNEAV